jgi:ATP-binding cassette subfamily C (CFTR/MRP) protein 1
LVMALARMLDLTSGRITIDGQDLATLKRSAVRSALNIVPQEPYFFHRTVSENLDPTGKSSAEAMQSALVKTQLWEVVEPNGGLDSELKTDILSLGQRQLLALARAILNPSRVVILDEATSK